NVILGIRSLVRTSRIASLGLAGAITIGFLFLVVIGLLGWRVYEANHVKQGIIVEQKVDIRSGPGEQNVTVFTVHEGTKVRIRGYAPGWYQVSLANGWVGWLEGNTVRIL